MCKANRVVMVMFQKLLVCCNVFTQCNELSAVVVSDSSSSSTDHFSDVSMAQGLQDTTDTLTNTAAAKRLIKLNFY